MTATQTDNQATAKMILESLREQIESFDLEMEEPAQILFGTWAETLAKALDLLEN